MKGFPHKLSDCLNHRLHHILQCHAHVQGGPPGEDGVKVVELYVVEFTEFAATTECLFR